MTPVSPAPRLANCNEHVLPQQHRHSASNPVRTTEAYEVLLLSGHAFCDEHREEGIDHLPDPYSNDSAAWRLACSWASVKFRSTESHVTTSFPSPRFLSTLLRQRHNKTQHCGAPSMGSTESKGGKAALPSSGSCIKQRQIATGKRHNSFSGDLDCGRQATDQI